MAHFDELMQRALTVRNNVAPSSNTAILVGGVLVSIVSALQLLLDTKQGTLTFDDEPTDGSTNPVTSDGIYEAIADAIASIDLSACEKIVNKVTALSAQSTDVQYPTAKCVYDALQAIDLSACEKIVNKVTSLSAQSTDTQYPSAKCVYDALQAIDLSACEKIVNKVTSLSAQSTDTQYPSAKCVYDALQAIDLSVYELLANKVTSLSAQSTDTQYPSAKCVYDALQAIDLSACEKIVNKVTSLSAQSTDTQYPSAKCVYDAIQSINLSAYELIANKVTALTAQATDTQYPSAKAVYDCCIAVQAALQSLDERVTRLEAFHYETYYIRGTSTNVGGTESFTLTMVDLLYGTTSVVTFTAEVDANGAWKVEYKGKKIYSMRNGNNGTFDGKTTITSLELTEPLDECISAYRAFNSMVATTIDLPNATFEKCTTVELAFSGFSGTTVNMPKATFAVATSISGLFYNAANITAIDLPEATFAAATGMYYGICFGCTNVLTIDMPKAIFGNLTTCANMFRKCSKVVSVDLSAATFAASTNTRGMFRECSLLEMINWSDTLNFNNVVYMGSIGNQDSGMFVSCPKLTSAAVAKLGNQQFLSAIQATNMFYACASLTKIDLHAAVFGELNDCWGMFADCTNVTEIDMSAATFAKMATTTFSSYHCFRTTNSLTTLKVPTNSTAILPTSTAANAPLNLQWSPLDYTSMLAVANWVSDLTGQSAHTVTFKTSAWSALTAAEQATILGILQAKNWNLATA